MVKLFLKNFAKPILSFYFGRTNPQLLIVDLRINYKAI